MSDVTRILSAIERGDEQAAGELLPLVYDELRQLPSQQPSPERPRPTLQATGLVHEVCLRLRDGKAARLWESRASVHRRGRADATNSDRRHA
jgi:hypothetical protein